MGFNYLEIKDCPFLKYTGVIVRCEAINPSERLIECKQQYDYDAPLELCPIFALKARLTEVENSIPSKEEDAYDRGYKRGLDDSFEEYTKRLTNLIKDNGKS